MGKYSKIKKNCSQLILFSEEKRSDTLREIAKNILNFKDEILKANEQDIQNGKNANLSEAIMDRLLLSDSRIAELAKSCEEIANQKQVVGIFESEVSRSNGLVVKTQRVPLGLLAMIFESRPNVVVDAMALSIKSANGLVLKGGKEAKNTNSFLFQLVQSVFVKNFNLNVYLLLEDRDEVNDLLTQKDDIDLVIARGGSALVNFVKKNALMPVMAHDKGLCHLYVHFDAQSDWVSSVLIDSKLSRPGVCNALETLLLHESYPGNKEILNLLIKKGVLVKGCQKARQLVHDVVLIKESDFETEYLDKIINVKIVLDFQEALNHIAQYGSKHTEAIISSDQKIIQRFINEVDASCVVINSSTRFNDGGQLGLGAELGISTSKFHAFGPVGAKQMTTTRFVVIGKGQVRN